MPRKFKFTEEEQLRFDHFVTTDEFAGATESLEKYDSFNLGYQKEKESISALLPI